MVDTKAQRPQRTVGYTGAQVDQPNGSETLNLDARAVLIESVSKAADALAAAQMADELGATTKSSVIGSSIKVAPSRDRLFDPESDHVPLARSKNSWFLWVGGLVGFILPVSVAADFALQSPFSDVWRRLALDRSIEIASWNPPTAAQSRYDREAVTTAPPTPTVAQNTPDREDSAAAGTDWPTPVKNQLVAATTPSDPPHVIELASSGLDTTTLDMGGARAVPRLNGGPSRAASGEPAPLGVTLKGQVEGAVVVITGLVPGMDLSTGASVGANAWEVPANDIDVAWIGPPENFIGSVDLILELRLSNNEISDRLAIRFDWVPRISPAGVRNQPDQEAIGSAKLPASTMLEQNIRDRLTDSLPLRPNYEDIVAPELPRPTTLAQDTPDREEGMTPTSDPFIANQLDPEEIAAVLPIPIMLAPNIDDQKEATAVSAEPFIANRLEPEEIAAVLPTLTLAQNIVDQEEGTIGSTDPLPFISNRPDPGGAPGSTPTLAKNTVDKEDTTDTDRPSFTPDRLHQDDIAAAQTSTIDGGEGITLPHPISNQSSQEPIARTPPTSLPLARNPHNQAEISEEPSPPPAAPNRIRMAESGQPRSDQDKAKAAPMPLSAAKRNLDQEEIGLLLKRGKDLIATGDVAAARPVLQRAAEANDAEAALALGSTYDPLFLRQLKVYGFTADATMARAWYEKAKVFGSAAASRRLEMLSVGGH